jgi:hypothetical protein
LDEALNFGLLAERRRFLWRFARCSFLKRRIGQIESGAENAIKQPHAPKPTAVLLSGHRFPALSERKNTSRPF